MSQGKEHLIPQKNFFNSKTSALPGTHGGSSRKEQKVMLKHQYEDEYKDLAFQSSNDFVIEQKPKAKNFSGDTDDFKTKWKTEICHYWENGICQFGDNCAFAHGESELRNRKMSQTYKTKLCKRFFEIGYCSYGIRCQFSHQKPEKKHISYSYLLSRLNRNDYLKGNANNRPRLKTFENLALFNDPNEDRSQMKEGKGSESIDHINSMDTKDNDKEESGSKRNRYLTV